MSNPMETPGAFSWMEHRRGGDEAIQGFYRALLGWNITPTPMQDGGSYPVIEVAGRTMGGFAPAAEEGGWLPYITVSDVDDRVQAAVKAGATVVSPAFDAPGVGRMATLADPSGTRFALIAYAAPEA